MFWLLACTPSEPVADATPPSNAYDGRPEFTAVHHTCRTNDHDWRVYSRGTAQVLLDLDFQPVEDDIDDDSGASDTGLLDSAAPRIEEQHDVPIADQDPGGWWVLHTLALQYWATGGQGRTQVRCEDADDSWTLRLVLDDVVLDCEGSAC